MILPSKPWFEARVRKDGAHGCWVWHGRRDKDGYGAICTAAPEWKHVRAHRAAWMLYRGGIPVGSNVLHTCDNRTCVNPAHLYLGSQRDNINDMWRRGRARHHLRDCGGEENGNAVLCADDVVAIRSIAKGNVVSRREIADLFGVTVSCVAKLLTRKTWPTL